MPELALADDFLDAYSKIPKKMQKKVRQFTKKFRDNPTASSINYEKINNVKDDRVRTVRIDKKYRAIVLHPDRGSVYTLVWVDNHDEAMAWAANRTFATHPETGALQIVNTVTIDETVSQPVATAPPEATGLFDAVDDDTLLSFGVPPVVMPSIRQTTTTGQLAQLLPHLPGEAAEALKWLAEEIPVEEVREYLAASQPAVEPNAAGTDKTLENPDTRRRIIKIESDEELDRILDAPLEKWRLFLHPSQAALADGNFPGPVLVLGGAGTGKTVVAMHRARHLAHDVFTDQGDRVLFTTFNATLATNTADNLRKLCGDELKRIDVVHLHAWAVRFMKQQGKEFDIADDKTITDCWDKAILESAVSEWNVGLIRGEWEYVVESQGISTREEYLQVDRTGRSVPLNRAQRNELWKAFANYQDQLAQRGKTDWMGMIRLTRVYLEEHPELRPYRSIVVDESQDFYPEDWRLMRAMVAPGPNDLFLVGDPRQRIYGRPLALSRCGIHTEDRVYRLQINYRTTEQIRDWAVQLLADQQFDDLNGQLDHLIGYQSLLTGPAPAVHCFDSVQREVQFVESVIEDLLKSYAPEEICITARKQRLLYPFREALEKRNWPVLILERGAKESQPGIRLANMHRIKGLEFPCMIVVGVNDDTIPVHVKELEDDASAMQEHLASERCLLHVAATRARDRVVVTSSGPPSRFLKSLSDEPTADSQAA